MARTIQDEWNEDWKQEEETGSGGRRNNEDMEEGTTCRKLGIMLGGFHTEVEVLAELHLRYPWVQLTRRINGAGNTILIAKDDRSRKLLAEPAAINGKECSFRPLGN